MPGSFTLSPSGMPGNLRLYDMSGNGAGPFMVASLQVDTNGNALPTGPNVDTGALITHTAASAGANSADQTNNGGQAINIVIDVTAISGTTPTLTVTLQGKDSASGKYYNILVSAAISAVGTTVLQVFPGATASANSAANAILPKTWRVITAIGGTTPSVTATVGASVVV